MSLNWCPLMTRAAGLFALLFALLAAGGCVDPGRVDANLITRYQQYVLNHSPQARGGSSGLDLLSNLPEPPVIPLRIEPDPAGGARRVYLSLDQAIALALKNNQDIRIVSFDPAIAREDMVRAAAAFDAVVFGSAIQSTVDHRQPNPTFTSETRTWAFEAGVRQKFITGAQAELKWDVTRTHDNSTQFLTLNPRWESIAQLQITQPLLRGAGRDYNLSQLRVAQIGHKNQLALFRQKVEEVVAQVRTAYWTLVQARRDVEIQEALLDQTSITLDRVINRRGIDATDVEVKQTEAAIEMRRAALVRARKSVFDVQDQLARLLSDPRLSLAGRFVVIPTSPPVTETIHLDPTDQLINAMQFSPLLEQARLAIAANDINVGVAQNETLPTLNLVASGAIQGLKGDWDKAIDQMGNRGHRDHTLGLQFEYPLGNRAALAALRQQKFDRLKNITRMQDVADQLAINVNEAIRQIETTYDEVRASKAAVEASRAQLTALDSSERLRGKLSPEFLQVKLQAQETLSSADRSLTQAIVNYNNALARLAYVTGTTLQQHAVRVIADDLMDAQPLLLVRPVLPALEPTTAPATAPSTGALTPAIP